MIINLVVKNSKGKLEQLNFKVIRSLSGNLVDLNVGIVPLKELKDWMATFGYSIVSANILTDMETNDEKKKIK